MAQNKLFLLFLVLVVLFLIDTTQSFGQSRVADKNVISYLEKFRSDFTKCMMDKKSDVMQTYYDDNIRLMPEFQKTVKGKTNALLYYKAFLTRFDVVEYKREEAETIDLGTRVVESGNFSMKFKLKSTAKEYTQKGKYQDIWGKLNKDKLLLLTCAWNHNERSEVDEHFRFADVPGVQTALQAHVPIHDNISFELAALNKLMEISIIQHDSKVWAQFYTEDVILLSNFSPIRRGKREVEKYLDEHVDEMPVFEKLDIRNDEIDHQDAYVIEYASHVATWRNGNSSGVNTGKNIRIWRREPDGALKMFRQIGSYD